MGGTAATAGSHGPVARYPLGLDMAVTISPDDLDTVPTWSCAVQHRDGPDGWRAAGEGDGAAEAFVDVLRHTVTVPAEGFRVVRLFPPPEATSERVVEAGETDLSVVVGERVVVTWFRQLSDRDHPAPLTLAHLAEIRFLGVPVAHGLLTWRAPSGRELPCAMATGYLPRARDGWQWCRELLEQRLGARSSRSSADAAGLGGLTGSIPVLDSWVNDFPARIGRLAGKLHVALATPSRLLPQPVSTVGATTVRHWHAAAHERLETVIKVVQANTLGDAAHVLLPRAKALGTTMDQLDEIADHLPEDADVTAGGREGVQVQRIHGDLHPGKLLRWPGGLAVVDFDGNPMLGSDRLAALESPSSQPAARDVAQLLLNLDYVGRLADERSGFRLTDAVDDWSQQARTQLLDAYRSELVYADMRELLDERLLPAFEAEQACRELLYAARHLPRWAYAPLAGLRLMIPASGRTGPGGRHRAQQPPSAPDA